MTSRTTVLWRQVGQPSHAPAYNAVPARKTFTMPAEEQAAPASPPQPRKVDWPPPVREYVRRAFDPDYAVPGIEQEEMQIKLRQIITSFAEKEMLFDVDWANYPLPQTFIANKRRAAATRALASGSGINIGLSQSFSPLHITPQANHTNPTPANVNSPQHSKKRKSMDDTHAEQADQSIPPWRRANRNMLEDRITRDPKVKADKRAKKGVGLAGEIPSKFDQADLEKRKKRFGADKTSSASDSDSEMSTGPVIGTCQNLEKRYLRLTAPPKAEAVRPQHVLEKTLLLLKEKWKQEKNYNYICDQFKSLRQDLTVQHIKNAFTVSVYECHARIALEKGDLGEYNQCQTQLRALYSQKLGGHPEEFLAYRVLYYIYTCNQTDMNDLLAELTPADKAQAAVKHALDVRSSLALGNYHKFIQLYIIAPNMGAYLMDMFIERERLAALANIAKAYMSVTLRFLSDELGFESDPECAEFLQSRGAEQLFQSTESGYRVNIGQGKALFDQLRAAAFSKVDIKGQI
ncbi:hypothetical protein GQ43DRAFT_278521 [Delitschia confertaspora ATCC 74209]|uniref:PCI domain-containing protein n=1 Tax=Delitschia confertaspora ATCC 74209 TaxID=1513339 RepID=A0A9P4MML9_9PLEO|nr:hypothetical protein GQ43DRAFT_278521 [Delitschia confertaspora ATCC 74209]